MSDRCTVCSHFYLCEDCAQKAGHPEHPLASRAVRGSTFNMLAYWRRSSMSHSWSDYYFFCTITLVLRKLCKNRTSIWSRNPSLTERSDNHHRNPRSRVLGFFEAANIPQQREHLCKSRGAHVADDQLIKFIRWAAPGCYFPSWFWWRQFGFSHIASALSALCVRSRLFA